MINARAVATLGIGYGPKATATLGLLRAERDTLKRYRSFYDWRADLALEQSERIRRDDSEILEFLTVWVSGPWAS